MDDTLERMIERKLDGRLSPAECAAVDAAIANDPGARRFEREALALRGALRAQSGPRMPIDLNRRIHERLAVVREGERLHLRVLRPVRWFAAAAALVFTVALGALALGVGGSPFRGGQVQAAPQRTIEDDLRRAADDPASPSLVPFLHKWLFGSDRSAR
jgi:anti-sigma factor RsiW